MPTTFDLARCGDPFAMQAVVERLRPRLVRLAAHYARCTGEDADDLLQEAWLSLLVSLPKLDTTIGSPDQYLIQRARWGLLDSVRRSLLRRCVALEETDPIEKNAASVTVTPPCDEALLFDFVARLTPTQRSVVRCLLLGMTWREAGQVLGFTSANVAYHVRQIRQRYVKWNEGII